MSAVSHARLKDIASKAKVSVATASLALNGKGRISEEVRSRVRDTADQLGYRPRRPAQPRAGRRGLRGDPSRGGPGVRVALHPAHHPGAGACDAPEGALPVLIPASTRAEPEKVARHVLDAGVRAVFALQMSDGAVFAELRARGIQVVVINNSGFQARFHSVCVDDFQGAYEGTLSLLALGHRSLAFVEYARPESPNVVADRFIGFPQGAGGAARRLFPGPAHHRPVHGREEAGEEARRPVLARARSRRRSSPTTTTWACT